MSPCVRRCTLDERDNCLGCGRSLSEILEWHALDAAGRCDVLTRASERIEAQRRRFAGGGHRS